MAKFLAIVTSTDYRVYYENTAIVKAKTEEKAEAKVRKRLDLFPTAHQVALIPFNNLVDGWRHERL